MKTRLKIILAWVFGIGIGFLIARQWQAPRAGTFVEELPTAWATALDRKADIVAEQMSMVDLLRHAGEQYKLPIRLDEPAWRFQGLGTDRRVTVRYIGLSLEQWVLAMQADYDLFAIVDQDGLVLVPREVAHAGRVARMYDVGPILDHLRHEMSYGDFRATIERELFERFIKNHGFRPEDSFDVVLYERALLIRGTPFWQHLVARRLNAVADRLEVSRGR